VENYKIPEPEPGRTDRDKLQNPQNGVGKGTQRISRGGFEGPDETGRTALKAISQA